jgi:hypothetical protein
MLQLEGEKVINDIKPQKNPGTIGVGGRNGGGGGGIENMVDRRQSQHLSRPKCFLLLSIYAAYSISITR